MPAIAIRKYIPERERVYVCACLRVCVSACMCLYMHAFMCRCVWMSMRL